jgi:putative SOS response-associated peptidase YedK
MCGRMSLFNPQPEIERRFSAEFTEEWSPRYNIAPQQDLAVIQNDAPEEINQLKWGLIPHWVDDPDDWPKPINARAETVSEKASFREAFEKRRCLVLADGFYEWKGTRGSKQPYRIERVNDEPFAFAGLWETWSSNGDSLETVTIITTEPNSVMEPIHDRMPVMLEQDEEEAWLKGEDPHELEAMLDPYPSEQTDAYEITTAVNNPENDSLEVIAHNGDGQSGVEEFSESDWATLVERCPSLHFQKLGCRQFYQHPSGIRRVAIGPEYTP